MTTSQYRELFRLSGNVSTAAPATSQRKRTTMREQIDGGERSYPLPGPAVPPG